MSDDSATHQLLGSLKADMEASQRQRASLFDLARETNTQVTTMAAQQKAHIEKQDALEISHNALIARVAGLEGDRNRIVGAGAAIAAATGGAWAKITGFFS